MCMRASRPVVYPNCRKLANELEVSSKTVQRDLDFMRDRLGLPIAYGQLHFGFFYSEPVASFPNIEISEGELVALYIGPGSPGPVQRNIL